MSTRLRINTANIGRGVPADKARANMTKVRRGPLRWRRTPSGVLWQELDDDDRPWERGILHNLYTDHTTWPPHNHMPGCAVPVTLPDPWRIAEHTATKVSDGKAKISPDRYVVRVVATHPDLTDPVAFVSFQLVAGAFTNPGQAAEQYRRDAYAAGFAGAKGIVHDTALQGLTVIGGNDGNNPRMAAIHPRQQTVVHQSLDYLWVVEGSTRVSVRAKGITDLSIDGHNSPWAVLDLSDKH